MASSFVAYIDESGDEGFRFEAGASTWFVLSAVVVPKSNELAVVKLVDEVRALFGWKSDHAPLHFRDLKHEFRRPYLARLASAPLSALTVLVHKPSITEVEKFQQKNVLYFHAVRYLLERVSWYCRDHRRLAASGDGSAKIVFSNRAQLSIPDLCAYMVDLREHTSVLDVAVQWDVIKENLFSVAHPRGTMGLQLADAVASSFYLGLQPDRFEMTDPGYVTQLKPIMYHDGGRYRGYGLKFWPRDYDSALFAGNGLAWLKDIYSFK